MKVLSIRMLAVAGVAATLFACNSASENKDADAKTETNEQQGHDHSAHAAPSAKEATVTIAATYPDTALNGTAKFTADESGKIKLDLSITAPSRAGKSVAVHLHAHGDCGEHGMASHGHWNPTGKPHGKWGSEQGFHSGDIGNVTLDAQGSGTLSMETDLWTLGGTDTTKNILGKALIVHGGQDDYTTQPTGNAGNRIGCGVIQ